MIRSNRPAVPTLFNGPEAVLGILLAAAALLADFTRGLVYIATNASSSNDGVRKGLGDVDRSIALLHMALDESKQILKATEDELDASIMRANSAEQALAGLGDSRDKLMTALDQAAKADIEVNRIERYLEEEREGRKAVEGGKQVLGTEIEQIILDMEKREKEVEQLGAMVVEVRSWGEEKLGGYTKREVELREVIEKNQRDFEKVKEEREQLASEAREMEKKASTMAEQVSAAALALEETRRELQQVESDLLERRVESERVDEASLEIDKRNKESKHWKEVVAKMKGELKELQSELKERDKTVRSVARESDELRSLLATRDAELREVSERLASAMANERETGGDSRRSHLKLEEIKKNLDAEQLALSAEIARAELKKSDLGDDVLDEIDRLAMELEAEGRLLQAGLRKAEASVRLEEHQQQRKNRAVEDILESIEEDDGLVTLDDISEELSLPSNIDPKPRLHGGSPTVKGTDQSVDVEAQKPTTVVDLDTAEGESAPSAAHEGIADERQETTETPLPLREDMSDVSRGSTKILTAPYEKTELNRGAERTAQLLELIDNRNEGGARSEPMDVAEEESKDERRRVSSTNREPIQMIREVMPERNSRVEGETGKGDMVEEVIARSEAVRSAERAVDIHISNSGNGGRQSTELSTELPDSLDDAIMQRNGQKPNQEKARKEKSGRKRRGKQTKNDEQGQGSGEPGKRKRGRPKKSER